MNALAYLSLAIVVLAKFTVSAPVPCIATEQEYEIQNGVKVPVPALCL